MTFTYSDRLSFEVSFSVDTEIFPTEISGLELSLEFGGKKILLYNVSSELF
jgi:hypothetical protein